jgi:hypothetical protein
MKLLEYVKLILIYENFDLIIEYILFPIYIQK